MGFSIGRFLGNLAGSVASSIPVIGPIISAASAGFVSPARPQGPSQVGPTVIRGGSGVSTLPGMGGVVPMVIRGASLIAGLLARASAAIGKRITRAGVIALSRDVGIITAASALSLTAVEVAQIIASKPRRRRRGITASQIATTKATMRRVNSLNRAIAKACPPAAARRAALRK